MTENCNQPKILIDICDYLKNINVNISDNIEGEGRAGSLKDEGTIKRKLLEHDAFKYYIIDQKPRKFGDIIVLDYDGKTQYVINIKTSMGSTDNCFSKAGIVYALTDIPIDNIPASMNFNTFNELIKNNGKDIPERDYWFLCVDKNDSSNIMIRGVKQINCWTVNINPSNILQINWKKEKLTSPAERSYEETVEIIINGVKESLKGFYCNLPIEWRDEWLEQS